MNKVLIFLFLITLIGCNSTNNIPDTPTATSLPATETAVSTTTPTLTPTETPAPTLISPPTPDLQSTRQIEQTATLNAINQENHFSNWTLLIKDNFGANYNGWPTGHFDDELITGYHIIQNTYQWDLQAKSDVNLTAYAHIPDVQNFFVSVEARQVTGEGTYGVIFEESDGELSYQFQLFQNYFSFYALNLATEELTILIDWTESPEIFADRMNTLAMLAEGEQFTLFINNQQVGQVSDQEHTSGSIGVAIALSAEAEGVFEFDNFEVRAP